MNQYDYMTHAQRMRRLGELCAKAVTLHVLAEREAGRKAQEAVVATTVEQEEPDWITRGVVKYMKRCGWVSPREMLRYLEVTRTTLFRRLRDLRERGMVESRGNGRGIKYRLAVPA